VQARAAVLRQRVVRACRREEESEESVVCVQWGKCFKEEEGRKR